MINSVYLYAVYINVGRSVYDTTSIVRCDGTYLYLFNKILLILSNIYLNILIICHFGKRLRYSIFLSYEYIIAKVICDTVRTSFI